MQKNVILVGGLDKLEKSYRDVIESLGLECEWHNGQCQGLKGKRLGFMIKRADAVLFIVDHNSHNALRIAKKMCRINGKPFYALHGSGVSQLKRRILELLCI